MIEAIAKNLDPEIDVFASLKPIAKQIARQKLGIPNWVDVDCIYGAPYYWQGAGMYMTPVSFYQGGEYVAGADFDTATFQDMKSIYNYSHK